MPLKFSAPVVGSSFTISRRSACGIKLIVNAAPMLSSNAAKLTRQSISILIAANGSNLLPNWKFQNGAVHFEISR